MKRKKSLLRRLIPWLIVLVLGTLLTVFVLIPLYGSPSKVTGGMPPIRRVALENDDPLVMENEFLRFEMDVETTQFVITDKATGHAWRSNPENAKNDPLATAGENKARLQSTLIVSSTTTRGVSSDLNNFSYSVENGLYELFVQEDGSIRVDYTVGPISKMYVFPLVITQERMESYLANMSKRDATSAEGNYRFLEKAKLKESELPELLAMYPSLEDTNLYVLREGEKSFNDRKKNALQEKFIEAGYTTDDLASDTLLMTGTKEENVAAFNVSMIYRLEGGDLVVEIPYDGIQTNPEYALTSLTPLPNFGAAGTADTGFMFVPEGGGALIEYNNGKLAQNSYFANLYGWDYASERLMLVNETRVSYPVFGMATGDESFLCMMEGMTSLGGVQAAISGRTNSYNLCNAKYIVQHGDKYNVSAKTSETVYMFEQGIPSGVIRHRYRFLPSADYVDMAIAYRGYLMEHYPELISDRSSEDMPVLVEFVGAIDKTQQRMGLPVITTTATTTFDEARGMLQTLQQSGLRNVNLRMSGWCNGGVSQQVLTSVRTLKELGGDRALAALIQSAESADTRLYLEGVSTFAYRSNVLQGFIPFRDSARFATREEVSIQPYNSITYTQTPWLEPFYLVKPSFADRCAQNLIARVRALGAQGVAFRDIGSILSGDYDYLNNTNRERVLEMNVALLQKASDMGLHILIKKGNDYAMPYASLIADMDLLGTPYSIIDLNIPFYQIALHGLKDYTCKSVNLSGDYIMEILRAAEYGAGLSFTFMAENPEIVQDTVYSSYYASSWENWHETAIDEITRYQEAMKGLGAQHIVGHRASPDGEQTVTTYENGVRVYVNYSLDDAVMDGVSIASRSYYVEGGDAR